MNFYYPYKPADKSVSTRTPTPMKMIKNQLELAPYLPMLAKEAHLQLAKAHMEIAENMTNIPESKIEHMSNTDNENILAFVQQQALEYISLLNDK
jgi:hypothetical protein